MSAAGTAHQKIVTLLGTYAPSPSFETVYDSHVTANLIVPSLSVDVETDTAIANDAALVDQELVDNRNVQLTIRVHMAYRHGYVNTNDATDITDEIIRWLREHINLGDEYRIFEVTGAAYNVELSSSGTLGSEIIVNVHKPEYYEQA